MTSIKCFFHCFLASSFNASLFHSLFQFSRPHSASHPYSSSFPATGSFCWASNLEAKEATKALYITCWQVGNLSSKMLMSISAMAQLQRAPLACHLCHLREHLSLMMQCKWCPLELCNSVILTAMWDSKAFKSKSLCWAIILKPLAEQLMGKMLSRWRPGSQPGHLSLQIMPLCI